MTTHSSPMSDTDAFKALIERENDNIFPAEANVDDTRRGVDRPVRRAIRARDDPKVCVNPGAQEPRVLFRGADVLGLALSGGGIRSATFNLGLLQGMHRLRMLSLFDYLSTVSGGGYVGSFWSAWLARRAPDRPAKPEPDEYFPSALEPCAGPRDQVDSAQERHLREFSSFLAPRWGFFEVEMWAAIVAFIAGLLPALATALAVIGIALMIWLVVATPLALEDWVGRTLTVLLVTCAVLTACELTWQAQRRPACACSPLGRVPAPRVWRIHYAVLTVIALLLVGSIQATLPRDPTGDNGKRYVVRSGQWQKAESSEVDRWWQLTGIPKANDTKAQLEVRWTGESAWYRRPPFFSPRLFDYPLAWLLAALALIVLRLFDAMLPERFSRDTVAALDRVVSRLLALAVAWVGIAVLWHLAVSWKYIWTAATAAVFSAGGFAKLRNWLSAGLRRPQEPGLLDRFKPLIPQVLAYLTIGLAVIIVGHLLIVACHQEWERWGAAVVLMCTPMIITLFIQPDRYGLHGFYRDRLSRAYAGACPKQGEKEISNGAAAQNRSTEPQDHDTLLLRELPNRPLHLICCAANDLTGDPIATLGRGARSAVLSKCGFSLGPHSAPPGDLRLGSAVTASAAAFNSNMGHISRRIGPAVSFLMTALNLRLGLWVRHPLAGGDGHRPFPGWLLYREMFGRTNASILIDGSAASPSVPWAMRDVHLSDGGHFENLALYELVRRHCRYILLSDCGADPEVAFDDLGNAIRRIREDFGVDVGIDVAPLRPDAEGWSRQHVAVGTIDYSATDKGILLYVKPSLTGGEPPDVLQYKTRNKAFPHEATSDQFYDEAQWESYRRLGLHTAEVIFDFVAPAELAARTSECGASADWVFTTAAHQWGPTPEGLLDRVLTMTKRFGDLEAELQRRQPAPPVLAEVFPELSFLETRRVTAAPLLHWKSAHDGVRDRSASEADLWCLMRVTQLMEDVWLACDLDRCWSHPLNVGWINLFARWATAPTFTFWWPLLRPMYSKGFGDFVDQRFPVRDRRTNGRTGEWPIDEPLRGCVRVKECGRSRGLAELWWTERSAQPIHLQGRTVYEYVLESQHPTYGPVPMQVGVAAVREQGTNFFGWTSDDFFVPPSLWGAGIGWYFLDDLLALHDRLHFSTCYVIVKTPGVNRVNRVATEDRRSFIEHYKKMGFRQELPDDISRRSHPAKEFLRSLTPDGKLDGTETLLVLVLAEWFRRDIRRPQRTLRSETETGPRLSAHRLGLLALATMSGLGLAMSTRPGLRRLRRSTRGAEAVTAGLRSPPRQLGNGSR